MKKDSLKVSILWHQHQPFYKNGSGEYQMPWVRFHSTKDYLDLLLVLKKFPGIRQNYNLVPSLLSQIIDYTQNGLKDTTWELSEESADNLDVKKKAEILKLFFQANINNMIKPYPRYYELYLRMKDIIKDGHIEKSTDAFSAAEYRDLQVWYNLTWIGIESRKRENIQKLFIKGRNFSEADKKILFHETTQIMKQIISTFKELWHKDQIEISTSPFYHPILPLLCDNSICRESAPSLNLPKNQFIHPEDAEEQIVNALNYIEKNLGRKPSGIWPSEGAVSMEALDILARQGIKWSATDESILANTLGEKFSHSSIYMPYLLDTGRNQINLFFRDHYLSDAIGFVYSNWPYEQAVSDFINRLHVIRKLLIDQYGKNSLERLVVPIILDGENCWEYYEADGKPFLRLLYEKLTEDSTLETATFNQVLKAPLKPHKLTHIYPGSWINSNFNIWIGSEEDNKSWDILAQTRDFLVKQENEGIHSDESIRQAWEKIYIAEGSDWNWWYGEEHSSANDMEFDQLYREHLIDIYRMLDQEIPAILYQTIKRIHFDRFESTKPRNYIYPIIDGKSSHYYEWVGAALYEIGKTPQTAMHQVANILNCLYVGFSEERLFLRIDFLKKPDPLVEFILAIKRPKNVTIVISPLRGIIEKYEMEDEILVKSNLKPSYRLGKVLEVGIPFQDLNIPKDETIGFQILVKLSGKTLEEYPRMNLIELGIPSNDYNLVEWTV
jgi:alpha-amylase/alpha-mannosidase (GH57 family)